MPICFKRRRGPEFSDVVDIQKGPGGPEIRARVVGNQKNARVELPDGGVIKGRVRLVPVEVEGGQFGRAWEFVPRGGERGFFFGEQPLSDSGRR